MIARREALQKKIKEAEEQLRKMAARDSEAHRRLETRKAILIGAVVLKAVRDGEVLQLGALRAADEASLRTLLDRRLKRDHDRKAFDLPPLPPQDGARTPAAPAKAAAA
ncbi:MAG: hypothetical protein WC809_07270 [Sinimarinibacterium sp.]|jgi:hypothetical protein